MPSLSSILICRWNIPDIRPSLIAECAVLLIRSPHFSTIVTYIWLHPWASSYPPPPPPTTTTTTTTTTTHTHTHPHTPTPNTHPPYPPGPWPLWYYSGFPPPPTLGPQLLPFPRSPFHPISTLPDFSDSTPKLSTQSVNAPSPTHQPLNWSCYYCLLLLPTPLQPCHLLFKLAYMCFMATPSTLRDKGTCGRFCWVPRHCGMEGNDSGPASKKDTWPWPRPVGNCSLCRF